jgi:hypothetical protein
MKTALVIFLLMIVLGVFYEFFTYSGLWLWWPH